MDNYTSFMSEWDTERNGRTPDGVLKSSHLKAWWICSNGHKWQSRVYSRNAGCGCPYCSGRLATQENNLMVIYPVVSHSWHSIKNGTLTPLMVTPRSTKKVWWKCDKGHEWKTPVYVRTSMGCGCPVCAERFKVSKIELRIFAELKTLMCGVVRGKKIAGRECDVFIGQYAIAIEFDGYYWHKGREIQDIKKNASLAKEGIRVVRVRQTPLTLTSKEDVIVLQSDSDRKVVDLIVSRLQSMLGIDMTEYLNNKKFVNEEEYNQLVAKMNFPLNGESLGAVYPKSVEIWDTTRNGDLTPYSVSPHSHISVWCKCGKGHKWKASVSNIRQGKNCPYCVGQKTSVDNSLEFLFPDISRQWNYKRNGMLTPDLITKSSGRKVWWVCDKGHEWEEIIGNRTKRKTGCPYCSGRRQICFNLTPPAKA